MSEQREDKKVNVAGVVLTVLITMGFIWAIYQLSMLSDEKKPLTRKEMRANEVEAFRNIKRIAEAQEDYRREDWDKDGEKVYAMFYVHLWTSVSLNSEPIPVNLLPREIAFAMEESATLDGYYFIDLRKRVMGDGTRREFDYAEEWAVAALPGSRGRTGLLTFIVDQGGVVYVTSELYRRTEYPHDPVQKGWTRVDTIEELKKFQGGGAPSP